jgi:histidine phosphotransfer protein HptB
MTDLQTLDLTNLRNVTDSDAELERELFNEFIRSSNNLLENLHACLQEGGNEPWQKISHAFKGLSMNLGAKHLAELCRKSQDSWERPDSEKAELLNKIREEHIKVLQALQTEIR